MRSCASTTSCPIQLWTLMITIATFLARISSHRASCLPNQKVVETLRQKSYNNPRKTRKILQGRVQFPTGGDAVDTFTYPRQVRDPLIAADPVRIRNRQYSLDERRANARMSDPFPYRALSPRERVLYPAKRCKSPWGDCSSGFFIRRKYFPYADG